MHRLSKRLSAPGINGGPNAECTAAVGTRPFISQDFERNLRNPGSACELLNKGSMNSKFSHQPVAEYFEMPDCDESTADSAYQRFLKEGSGSGSGFVHWLQSEAWERKELASSSEEIAITVTKVF